MALEKIEITLDEFLSTMKEILGEKSKKIQAANMEGVVIPVELAVWVVDFCDRFLGTQTGPENASPAPS